MNKIFSIKPSIKSAYISTFINLALFFGIVIVLVIIRNIINSAIDLSKFNFIGPICTIAFLVILAIIIKDWINTFTTYYTLNDSNFVLQTGLINIKRENLELYRIIDITTFRPFYYRLFNLSDIVLHTIDKTNPIIVLKGIEDYENIESSIKMQCKKHKPNVVEAVRTDEMVDVD